MAAGAVPVEVSGEASVGRDRVLDLTKSFALIVVVVAHAVAWDVSTGEPASVLDLRPGLAWVTWMLQVLPLFFAAGAVTNLASWHRHPTHVDFWRRRISRLATPALLYAGVWTALLLPVALWVEQTEMVGRYLAQLMWFLGVYTAIVVAVPWTARFAGSPLPTLALGLALIVTVDMLRWQVAPVLGWVNMLLVWGWLHQLGYMLPRLRLLGRAHLAVGGAAAFAIALSLAVVGPYSSSMVSTAGDPELSNLSPPTIVLALYGLAQVMVLAALWPALDRLMQRARVWVAVAAFGSRAIDVYLWHIPLVGTIVLVAWSLDLGPTPLSPAWWLLHLTVVAVVVPLAWLISGPIGRASRSLGTWAARHTRRAASPGATLGASLAVSAAILGLSQTGFATWWGDGLLGLPMSSMLLTAMLTVGWWAVATSGPSVNGSGAVRPDDLRGLPR